LKLRGVVDKTVDFSHWEKTAALMCPDAMLETFSELAVKEPDLMRLVLQACVAAMVNVQSVEVVNRIPSGRFWKESLA
jgi:hypothetical protein